jgi:pimeloyl-ACP methyl ester carboxylesterase
LPSTPDEPQVLKQVERIAASEVFVHAGRVNALLVYLVGAALRNGGARIDQRAIAMDVFGRSGDFDPGSDAIVRAEIGRLRAKLLEYYAGPGISDAVRIELKRGSYVPTMTLRSDGGQPDAAQSDGSHEIRYCRSEDDVSIAYSVSGAGYPLFYLPTWMSHLETDRRNPMLRHYWLELTRRFRVIRFDCRGFGLSDRDVPDFTIDTLVSDLHLVADTLGLERFALFGPSGGAMIGAAYASVHPERVSHLVTLGGFIRGLRAKGNAHDIAHADAMDAAIRVGWGKPEPLFRHIFTTMLVPRATPEQLRLLDQAQLDAGSAQSASRLHNLLANTDLTARAAKIRAATLIFHGTRESVPFDEAVHAASHIPNARLVPLPTDNHILLEDEQSWRLLLEELERFLPARHSAHFGSG